jgi:hypothetical protein
VELRHDIAPASIAVAGDRLPASATIRLPTVKDHDVPALADEFQIAADEFQIAKVPGFVRDTINNKFAIVVSLDFLQIKSRHRRARHDGKTRDAQKETIKVTAPAPETSSGSRGRVGQLELMFSAGVTLGDQPALPCAARRSRRREAGAQP